MERRLEIETGIEYMDVNPTLTLYYDEKRGYSNYLSLTDMKDEDVLNLISELIRLMNNDLKYLREWRKKFETPDPL